MMILHRSDEAIRQADIGLALDPLRPIVLGLYGVVMMNEGNHQSAILNFEKALSIDPSFGFAKGNLFISICTPPTLTEIMKSGLNFGRLK